MEELSAEVARARQELWDLPGAMRKVFWIFFWAFWLGVFFLPGPGVLWVAEAPLAGIVVGACVVWWAGWVRASRRVRVLGGDVESSRVARGRVAEVGGLTVLFVVVGAVVMVEFVPWRTRQFAETRGLAESAKFAVMAMELGAGFDEYVEEHGGRVPASMEEIATYGNDGDPQTFVARCREAFVYVPPSSVAEGEAEGIVVSRRSFGRVGRRVGYPAHRSEFVLERDVAPRLRRAVEGTGRGG